MTDLEKFLEECEQHRKQFADATLNDDEWIKVCAILAHIEIPALLAMVRRLKAHHCINDTVIYDCDKIARGEKA